MFNFFALALYICSYQCEMMETPDGIEAMDNSGHHIKVPFFIETQILCHVQWHVIYQIRDPFIVF